VIRSDHDRIEALLDILDRNRPENPQAGPELTILGLAHLTAKSVYRPTTAGWNLLGDQGKPYRSGI
jgi:hypothetical protein